MGLFDAIKNILGSKKAEPAATIEDVPIATEAAIEKVKSATEVTTPVTVKAKKDTADKPKRETRKSLEKLTKVKIDELAQERLGVELDRRKSKADMIEAFMSAQKKAK